MAAASESERVHRDSPIPGETGMLRALLVVPDLKLPGAKAGLKAMRAYLERKGCSQYTTLTDSGASVFHFRLAFGALCTLCEPDDVLAVWIYSHGAAAPAPAANVFKLATGNFYLADLDKLNPVSWWRGTVWLLLHTCHSGHPDPQPSEAPVLETLCTSSQIIVVPVASYESIALGQADGGLLIRSIAAAEKEHGIKFQLQHFEQAMQQLHPDLRKTTVTKVQDLLAKASSANDIEQFARRFQHMVKLSTEVPLPPFGKHEPHCLMECIAAYAINDHQLYCALLTCAGIRQEGTETSTAAAGPPRSSSVESPGTPLEGEPVGVQQPLGERFLDMSLAMSPSEEPINEASPDSEGPPNDAYTESAGPLDDASQDSEGSEYATSTTSRNFTKRDYPGLQPTTPFFGAVVWGKPSPTISPQLRQQREQHLRSAEAALLFVQTVNCSAELQKNLVQLKAALPDSQMTELVKYCAKLM